MDALLLLQDSYTETSLVLLLTLALEFYQQDLHRQLFSLENAFFLKSIVVCSIYHLCAALTENIAVQLRFLFSLYSPFPAIPNWWIILLKCFICSHFVVVHMKVVSFYGPPINVMASFGYLVC